MQNAAVSAFMSARSLPPLVVIGTGVPAVATDSPAGFSSIETNGSGLISHRLDRPMQSGRFYWELLFAAGVLPGVTNEPFTHYDYAGWLTTKNSLLYSIGWQSKNWGAGEENLTPAPEAGDRIGFMFDADTKIMSFRTNGEAPSVSHDLSAQAGPFYAVFGWQVAPGSANEIRLGSAGCLYPPPPGYDYL
ncbi:MAG: SPRY domain-containing protein [Phenylobacterium sp.]|nr:SPRY domain-containing protein [Phenylobacterium sp.]